MGRGESGGISHTRGQEVHPLDRASCECRIGEAVTEERGFIFAKACMGWVRRSFVQGYRVTSGYAASYLGYVVLMRPIRPCEENRYTLRLPQYNLLCSCTLLICLAYLARARRAASHYARFWPIPFHLIAIFGGKSCAGAPTRPRIHPSLHRVRYPPLRRIAHSGRAFWCL